MARFFGEVGYGDSVEIRPGVWKDLITEFPYQGNVVRNTRNLVQGDKVNDDVTIGNSISIVADQYAIEYFFKIKYVRWAGVLWTVTTVEVQSPRLILSLGNVYNGPTPILVSPETPEFDPETGILTITDQMGVVYKNGDDILNEDDSPYTIDPDESITVVATPSLGYYFSPINEIEWIFTTDSV